MLEVRGNLWTYKTPDGQVPDVRCITTNGFVKKNGECVMGRGCAREARDKFPGLAKQLGLLISLHGNNVHSLGEYKGYGELVSFPVKHRWNQEADLDLIFRSAEQLRNHVNEVWDKDVVVVIPRPGCGNGGLKWEVVKDKIESILDDRFHIITF